MSAEIQLNQLFPNCVLELEAELDPDGSAEPIAKLTAVLHDKDLSVALAMAKLDEFDSWWRESALLVTVRFGQLDSKSWEAEVLAELEARGATNACGRCGHYKYSLYYGLYGLGSIIGTVYRADGLSLVTGSVRTIVLMCQKCGCLVFHDARILKMVEPEHRVDIVVPGSRDRIEVSRA